MVRSARVPLVIKMYFFPYSVPACLVRSVLATHVLSSLRQNNSSALLCAAQGADDRNIHPHSFRRAALPHYLLYSTRIHAHTHLHPLKLLICPRCHTQHFMLSSSLPLQPKPSSSNRGAKRNKQLINPPLTQSRISLPN